MLEEWTIVRQARDLTVPVMGVKATTAYMYVDFVSLVMV